MAMIPWDFTSAEDGIVARVKGLTQQGAGAWCRSVGTRKDLAAVAEEAQLAPAVWVVYDGHVVVRADEHTATLAHRWFVILTISSAASQNEAAPLNDQAGPRLKQLFEGLFGWLPPGCSTPLVPSTPPRPFFSPAKFAYYPLAFVSQSAHCAGLR